MFQYHVPDFSLAFFLHPSVVSGVFVACTPPVFDLFVSFCSSPVAVYFRIAQLMGIRYNLLFTKGV